MWENLIYVIYVNQWTLEPLKYLFELKETIRTQSPFEEPPFDTCDLDENNPDHKQYFYDIEKDLKFHWDVRKEIAERFMKSTRAVDNVDKVVFAEKFDWMYYTKEL